MNEELNDLLEKHGLKKTGARIRVLSVLKSKDTAASQPELEEIIGKEIDRVTLYRVLTAFEEKGIIHKILDMNGTAKYAVCDSSCTDKQHKDEHVHFNCTSCLNVYCMDTLHIPSLVMPRGFTSQVVNMMVYGICSKCNAQQLRN